MGTPAESASFTGDGPATMGKIMAVARALWSVRPGVEARMQVLEDVRPGHMLRKGLEEMARMVEDNGSLGQDPRVLLMLQIHWCGHADEELYIIRGWVLLKKVGRNRRVRWEDDNIESVDPSKSSERASFREAWYRGPVESSYVILVSQWR